MTYRKTIGIIGSRRRNNPQDAQEVEETARALYQFGDRFVSGGCPQGGDRFCEEIARKLGATIIIHHADWARYGRSAGFKRNGLIARDADVLIACVAEDRTGGTEDTIRKFLKTHSPDDLILV